MLFNFASTLLTAASILAVAKADNDLATIEVVGNKFFYSNNGSQFYIRGIAYQQDVSNSSSKSFVDPLADGDSCKRDIPYLKALNTNVIRVYALNESEDHTDCMTQLTNAGIYVIADLSQPDLSINRNDPTWTVQLYNRYTRVVDEFHNYTNILGFFAGNEVGNNVATSGASAFVKAAVRDTKAYIKNQGYRTIPVGYSSNDDSATRTFMADYFACGDEDVKADFYGINMYEWCGNSTFKTSGYEARTEELKNLSIPLFFSEYGCNVVQPRKFTDVQALYSDKMTDVWSGGIVYMYFEEANNYGLVSIKNGDVVTLDDYNNYKSEILKISPTSAASSEASASSTKLSCPTKNVDWKASTDLPPTPDDGLCTCMEGALGCAVSDSVDSKNYADLFSVVCGMVSCDSVNANGTTGEYGSYSFCSSKQKLSFVMDLYYKAQGSSNSACSFNGSASKKSASTASTCSSALSQAGTAGTGKVSATFSNTNAKSSGSGSGSGSGSSGSSSATSSSAKSSSANSINVPKVNNKLVGSIMAFVVFAGVSSILI